MRFLCAVIALLLPLSVVAANKHVSVSGSGTQSGDDWNNTLPQSFTPARGNTYYVADGSYSSKTWSVATSGTTLITIKKATVAEHGSSTGWSDAYGDGQATFSGDVSIQSSYFVFDGATRSGMESGYGFKINNSTLQLGLNYDANVDHVTNRYVEVSGSMDPANQDDNTACVDSAGDKHHIAWQYCYLHDAGNSCMQLNGTAHFLIEYCTLARNDGRTYMGEPDHSEIIILTDCSDATIRYNIIKEPASTAAFATPNGGHPGCSGGPVSDLYIYGNVFIGPDTTGGGCIYLFDTQINGDFYIVNNTFVNINASVWLDNGGTDACAQNLVFRNNLYVDATGFTGLNNVSSLTASHNAYWSSSGLSTGSSTYSTTGDPLTDYASGDFSLTSGAASSMDAGTSVSVSGQTFNVDMLGNTRAGDGKWDRGAIEYGSGGGDVTSPLINSATIGTSGTSITLAFDESVTFGAGGNGGWSLTLSGGSVSLTYSSGSGTANLVYSLSRTVYSGETLVSGLTYTQPGNGIEDTSGNDFAGTTNHAIVNNSTQVQIGTGSSTAPPSRITVLSP